MSRSSTPPAKKFCEVDGRRLAYVEAGTGRPIVLLHGNPTSSYLWRNVIPHLEGCGRVIAPDLIGHGDSDKLPASDGPGRYSFEVAYTYLDAMLEALGVEAQVTLVLHDWGSALGFHWAYKHPQRLRGIAYMEGIVTPLPSWDDWPEKARGIFQGFRSAKGEDLILERNMFIEGVLPSAVLRKLSDEEMAHYRAPFAAKDDRQTTLNWPRQIPIAGEPAHMVALVQEYASWLAQSPVPKLFINAEPGSILVGAQREFCRRWPNQTEVTVPGLHFIQEDSADEIGRAVAGWLATLS
jgi:haloalkane dehalogenase